MSKSTGPDTSLSRAQREALASEILGAPVAIRVAPGLRGPVAGTIVDETLGTLSVRVPGRSRPLCVPKTGLEGTISLPFGELPLRGDGLRVRPEDRTKRLLSGPRRLR